MVRFKVKDQQGKTYRVLSFCDNAGFVLADEDNNLLYEHLRMFIRKYKFLPQEEQ